MIEQSEIQKYIISQSGIDKNLTHCYRPHPEDGEGTGVAFCSWKGIPFCTDPPYCGNTMTSSTSLEACFVVLIF